MNRDRFGNPERILCAAIYVDTGKPEPARMSYAYPKTGIVFCGWRHGDCFVPLLDWKHRLTHQEVEAIEAIMPHQLRGRRQGFLTSCGRFVDRRDGWAIAVAAGQVEDDDHNMLVSEDLY